MRIPALRAMLTIVRPATPRPAVKRKPALRSDPFGPGQTRESMAALYPHVSFGTAKPRPGID